MKMAACHENDEEAIIFSSEPIQYDNFIFEIQTVILLRIWAVSSPIKMS
jgi:hypothetical protein